MEGFNRFIIDLSVAYNTPVWLVLVTPVFLFFSFVFIVILLYKILQPSYKLYRIDIFHKMIWKWQYKQSDIIDLWCYCPTCGTMLSVDDENCRTTKNLGEKITFFVCQTCDGAEKGRIIGGDRAYALSVIKRAILGKIRQKTFDIYAKPTFKDAK